LPHLSGGKIMNGTTKASGPTQHELQVLKAWIIGGIADAAAMKLGLSRRTVEAVVENLKDKCGYQHVIQVVACACERDWLKKGDGPW
jgi:DNA-binding NarL/FixJ family response regulator